MCYTSPKRTFYVGPIPRFLHVIPSPNQTGEEYIIDYQGNELTIEGLIGEICDLTPTENICNFDTQTLNSPPIQ